MIPPATAKLQQSPVTGSFSGSFRHAPSPADAAWRRRADAPSTPAPERMNDLQTVGTHNSYKQPMPAQTMAKIRAINPRMADALDYSHRH
jgi:hypothetical protein